MTVKLTELQRAEIQDRYAAGDVSQEVLAKLYGVSQAQVSNVLNPERALKKSRNYREAHPQACRKAEQKWLSTNSEKHAQADRNWQQANPEKNRAKARRHAAKYPERRRANLRRWCANNPERAHALSKARRAREQGAPGEGYSLVQWEQVCVVWGGCAYCDAQENLTVDHVRPLSKDGTHEPENLVPCCRSCNSSKNVRALSEWRDGQHLWVEVFAREVSAVILAVL